MAIVIKDGKITANEWVHVADDGNFPVGKCTVSCARFKLEHDNLLKRGDKQFGVRLRPEDQPEEIADDLSRLGLIVVEMGPFADGRVFSTVRLLRDQYGFAGEIRVSGDFLRDQMSYLARVGVNSFEFADDCDPANMLRAFEEFSVAYQAPNDPNHPFRYRVG